MEERITVEVTDVTSQYKPNGNPSSRLGAITVNEAVIEGALDTLLAQMAAEAEKVFLLKWQGGRVPRGAEVGRWIIGWTQHGIVRDANGLDIGTYERIKDNVGNPPLNEMVVFLNKVAE